MTSWSVGLLLVSVAALGSSTCAREEVARTDEAQRAAPEPPPSTSKAPPAATEGLRFPAAPRIVAIGDLHGDLAATRRALRLAGAIDDRDRWIGGALVVVQTGDQLDRGDDEQAILDLLARLEDEAARAGGALHVINGNHELMNPLFDFRYVTEGGFRDFVDAPGVAAADPRFARMPEEARARASAFAAGGPYARAMSRRHIAVVVGDTVFVHGGILPEFTRDLAELDRNVQKWLAGEHEDPQPVIGRAMDPEGPVWTRAYSADPGPRECEQLDLALRSLGAARMVVGHTVQKQGISSACSGKVWRIDVGLAAHYGGPTEVLAIEGDQVTVLGR